MTRTEKYVLDVLLKHPAGLSARAVQHQFPVDEKPEEIVLILNKLVAMGEAREGISGTTPIYRAAAFNPLEDPTPPLSDTHIAPDGAPPVVAKRRGGRPRNPVSTQRKVPPSTAPEKVDPKPEPADQVPGNLDEPYTDCAEEIMRMAFPLRPMVLRAAVFDDGSLILAGRYATSEFDPETSRKIYEVLHRHFSHDTPEA